MTTRDPLTMLLLGLAVGLLGSYSDDLLGGSAAVAVLQVVVWIAAGILLGRAAVASRGRREPRASSLRPTAS